MVETSCEQAAKVPGENESDHKDSLQASEAPPHELIDFTIVFGKQSSVVSRDLYSSVRELKAAIEEATGVQHEYQKLMVAGKMLKDDSATLKAVGIKKGSKVMLIGSKPDQVQAASAQPVDDKAVDDFEKKVSEEPLCKQDQHMKILAKGLPEDAVAGIAGRQIPLADAYNMLPGLLNSQGTKVRLTFKPELEQLWIGSATSTQKVPYGSISKIEAEAIEDRPEYSILVLHLGSGSRSKYYLYFFPSQHVAALKIRILGVASLL